MSERLRLDVWLDGMAVPAGTLVAEDNGAVGFAYREDYAAGGGMPLSLSMPLSGPLSGPQSGPQSGPKAAGSFGDVATRAFFGNLLPENNVTQQIRDREGLEVNDLAGILFHLGADCSGAISCLPAGSPPIKVPGVLATDYQALSDDETDRIITSLAERQRLPDDARDPSPLAGVQGKIALTVLPDGRWALPRAGIKAPTTHILKVPQRADAGDVRLEAAACRMARQVGLQASVPQTVTRSGCEGLLIERFDRVVDKGVVYRLHQEDFSQALGLPASLKYERNGAPGRRFDAAAIVRLLDQTAFPARAREAFLLASLFNLAVGNSDNHGKNHALLYVGRPVPEIAPLYDILPVRMSDRYTHQLAFRIGPAGQAADVDAEAMADYLAAFGMSAARGRRFLLGTVRPMLQKVEAATEALAAQGLKAFDDFVGQELRGLSDRLDLGLVLRERDYFAPKGGGWATS